MTELGIMYWEITLDIIALCLCGAAIVCLLRHRARWRQNIRPSGATQVRHDFGREVDLQLARQEVERSLQLLAKTIAGGPVDSAAGEGQPRPAAHGTSASGGAPRVLSMAEAKRDERSSYRRVKILAGKGFDAEEIARQVQLPLGEIDLIVNFQKQINGDKIGYQGAGG